MVIKISSVPLRVSLLGGGTDMPEFVEIGGNVGACLVMSLPFNVSAVASIPSYTEGVHVDPRVDTPLTSAVIEHIAENVPSHIAADVDQLTMLEDVPTKGTGLGSSAAWIRALIGLLSPVSRAVDASAAYGIERSVGSSCGYQDHVAAANPGFNLFSFHPDEKHGWRYKTEAVHSGSWLMRDHVRMYRVSGHRDSNSILAKQAASVPNKIDALVEMARLAREGADLLRNTEGRWDETVSQIGSLVNQSWKIKRAYAAGVSNAVVDSAIACALAHGACGAKLLGAGGCGYVVAIVPDRGKESVTTRIDTAMEELGFTPVPMQLTLKPTTKVHNIG